MTDDELPEWDNHGSPVSDPTALDIATAAITYEQGRSARTPESIAAAVLDALGPIREQERNFARRDGHEAGVIIGEVSERARILKCLQNMRFHPRQIARIIDDDD